MKKESEIEKQEPTGASNGTSFGHDLNTFLEQLKGLNGVDMRA